MSRRKGAKTVQLSISENQENKRVKTLVVANKTKHAFCLPPQRGDTDLLLNGEEEGKFLTPGENTVSVELWDRLTKGDKPNRGVTIALRSGSLEMVRLGEAHPDNLSWASRPESEFRAFLSQIKAVDKVVTIKEGLDGNKKLLGLCEERIDQILDEASKLTAGE
jgi:hypothetical protein